MKKILAIILTLAMVFSLTACGNGSKSGSSDKKDGVYSAALILNGTLGDKSFFDSANDGLVKLQEELGKDKFTFKVEQMGATPQDEAKWEPTLLDYCESGKYDVIICGTWQMEEALKNASEQFPDQKFIFFDETYGDGKDIPDNIYNVLFSQNEVAFLVGALAAKMTTDTSLDKINPEKQIGFLGGQENAIIYDFLLGYTQGAKYVDKDVEVSTAFVGNFYDSVAGKDLSITQFQNGIDIGFNVAGQAGLGQIEAAVDADKYAIGVDSDQAALLPKMAANIPTSALKNVGNAIEKAIKLDMDGNLKYGVAETHGLKDQGVELAKGENYEKIVPQEIREYIDQLEKDIADGKIVVETSNGKTVEEIKKLLENF